MSRAFVKERDAEAVEELPDRSLSEHPNDVTPEGLTQIDAELALARAAYAASQKSNDRAGLVSASRDMRYWASRRATAQIVLPPDNHEQVRFGATVKITREDGREQTFRIVGEDEANPAGDQFLMCRHWRRRCSESVLAIPFARESARPR